MAKPLGSGKLSVLVGKMFREFFYADLHEILFFYSIRDSFLFKNCQALFHMVKC